MESLFVLFSSMKMCFFKRQNLRQFAFELIEKEPKLITIEVDFKKNERKAKYPKKLVRSIQEVGKKYPFFVRDVCIKYADVCVLYRHPVFKKYEMSISETEASYYARLRKYVENNRSPAQFDVLQERENILRNRYPV